MKAKTTVKHTSQTASNPSQKGSDQKRDASSYSPAVPISVYRELARELEVAKRQLSVVKTQNSTLQQQNQALRQEVIRVIQSTANLHTVLQECEGKPTSLISSTPANLTNQSANAIHQVSPADRMADDLIAELDRTLTADIGARVASQSAANPTLRSVSPKSDEIVDGPFCEVAMADPLNESTHVPPAPLVIEQSVSPPNAIALEDEKTSSRFLGGIWLPLTLVFVIVTAFSAGFLIVLPFIQSDQ